ncbi:hypothetical protein ACIQFZ_37045 [Streptomyces sp. NPDC093064]|uniref:hypothetical protein n=1 Tax=Streptomyces sp. NPDC093064 TaxID=3366020 RepID=UPI003810AC2A
MRGSRTYFEAAARPRRGQFAALAEFIRELIVIGTNEGLAAARARGRVGGRPSVATEEVIKAARDLLPDPALFSYSYGQRTCSAA